MMFYYDNLQDDEMTILFFKTPTPACSDWRWEWSWPYSGAAQENPEVDWGRKECNCTSFWRISRSTSNCKGAPKAFEDPDEPEIRLILTKLLNFLRCENKWGNLLGCMNMHSGFPYIRVCTLLEWYEFLWYLLFH